MMCPGFKRLADAHALQMRANADLIEVITEEIPRYTVITFRRDGRIVAAVSTGEFAGELIDVVDANQVHRWVSVDNIISIRVSKAQPPSKYKRTIK